MVFFVLKPNRNLERYITLYFEIFELLEARSLKLPGLTLLLAFWLSWQDLTKFLLHLGDMEPMARCLIRSY